jgi:lysophospholipase L1-like esterase
MLKRNADRLPMETNAMKFSFRTAVYALIMAGIIAVAVELISYGYTLLILKDYTGGAAYTGQPLNTKLVYKSGDQRIEYYINNLGFRDRFHDLSQPARSRRVAVFGDSFTEGWGVRQADIWPVRLQKMLDDACGPGAFEVFNFGLRHTGPGFASRLYTRMVRELKPDVVIFASYAGNDFRDAHREAVQDVDIGNLVENNFGGGSQDFVFKPLSEGYRPFQCVINLIGYFKAMLRTKGMGGKLPAAHVEGENFKKLDPEIQRMALDNSIHLLLLQMALDNPAILPTLFHDVEKQQYDAYAGFLKPWVDSVTQDGGRFFLFVIPGSTQVGTEQFAELKQLGFIVNDDLLKLRGPQRALDAMAADMASAQGGKFQYADLTDAFAEATRKKRIYLKYDDHINADGHELVAARVFRTLQEKYPVLRECSAK